MMLGAGGGGAMQDPSSMMLEWGLGGGDPSGPLFTDAGGWGRAVHAGPLFTDAGVGAGGGGSTGPLFNDAGGWGWGPHACRTSLQSFPPSSLQPLPLPP